MKLLAELLQAHPLPPPEGDKGERGTVLIVGGPAECPGAVLLSGVAALRAGAGRVQLVAHPSVAPSLGTGVPESYVMSWDPERPVPPDVADRLGQADAVVLGPGYSGGFGPAAERLGTLTGGAPLVLDAGALEAAPALQSLPTLVLAPNTAEAEHLLGHPSSEAATELATRFGQPVAVRGAVSVVAHPDGRCWKRVAPPGLGTPGSGDVLVGVLGALLAAKTEPLIALAGAVALHADAGQLLARTMPSGYLAREVADAVPLARTRMAGR